MSRVASYLQEVVNFGGIPLCRGDIYLHCIADGFSKKDADSIAFFPRKAIDAEPWTLAEFHQLLMTHHASPV